MDLPMLFAAFLAVSVGVAVRSFVLARRSTKGAFVHHARQRGWSTGADGQSLTANANGIDVSVRWDFVRSRSGVMTNLRATATSLRDVRTYLDVRAKADGERTSLRTGDFDFDECFLVEGTSRSDACAILDDSVRAALIEFGPRGVFRYADDHVVLTWNDDALDDRLIEKAVTVVSSAARREARIFR